MIHIIFGSTLIGLGIWGVVDEWYYIKDLVAGGAPVALVLFGLFAIWMSLVYSNETNNPKGGEETEND